MSWQVHQIELEMQNEKLRRLHDALDAARDRYFDLYNLAPVAYCTITRLGLIQEANFKMAEMLGVAPQQLRQQRLSQLACFIMISHYVKSRLLLQNPKFVLVHTQAGDLGGKSCTSASSPGGT
jgi:PAS domain-containing protein